MSRPRSSFDTGHNPGSAQATFMSTGERPNHGHLTDSEVSLARTGSHDGEGREPLLEDFNPPRRRLAAQVVQNLSSLWHDSWELIISEEGIGVFKCSLAYLLGSLATFVPAFAAFLGPQEGKHIVATLTVYFHPARSQGSMYKAMLCAFLAFLYSAFISLTSMYVTIFFQKLHMIEMGHALVLVLFVGVGFGLIGWIKQKKGDPLVNVACSLASLSSIMVLTKEGAIQRGDISLTKVSQVLKMLLMGTSASVVVSFLVFPVSARKKLRSNVVALTRSMAIMQSMITESFVSRNERDLQGHKFIGASARQRKANSQLSKLLQETRLEHYVAGTEGEYLFEEKLVRWAQGITHDLAALHMSAHLAFEMLREPDYFHSRTDARGMSASTASNNGHGARLYSDTIYFRSPDLSISENSADSATAEDTAGDEQIASSSFLATEIFDNFIRQIGPSMRSLVDTLTDVFNEVAFRLAPEYESSVNPRLPVVLSQSVDEYREAQAEAFALLHQNIRKRNLTVQEQECFQGVYASCAHYSFSLLQFSEQSKQLLVILEEFQTEIHRQPRRKSWNWVRRWLWGRGRRSNGDNATNYPSRNSPIETNITRPMEMMELSSLENESRIQRMRDSASYRLWKVASFFGKDETKFAIKVGMGAALYASPSFLSLTRPFYLYWKGEWGLVSYMLVCSMTIGASNTIGFARFLGTCVGALFSIGVWYVAGANASALAFLGFLMANWTFYMSLLKGQGPLGRFIMLTYNLSVLYAYSLSQRTTDDDVDEGTSQNPDITKITLHRVGAVLSGCIWGIIITRGIWPISARKKLEATLRLVWLRLGRILQSDPLDKRITNPGVPMLYMTAQERLEMERLLSELEALRASARYEFELKRPFPDAAYCNIIQHTQAIVDILHALDLQLLSVTPVSEQEISILRYTMTDRQTLSGHITHLLEKMASSIKSDYPPIDVDISSMTHARGQLRAHIFLYRKEQEKSQPTIQEAYRLLYAYELVTSQVSNRIAQIVTEISQISFYRDEDVVS